MSSSDMGQMNSVRHEPVREWRIHLGAHKTASTHVQEVLALKRTHLRANGLDFIPNASVRKSGFAQALRGRSLAARVPGFRTRHLEQVLEERIDPLREGPDRILLSEENLIGGLHAACSLPVYASADAAIRNLRWLGKSAQALFFLSIRCFDQQIPSSYAHALRISAPPEGGFERVKQSILADPPSWAGLVRRIRELAPDIPLVVWRQEDYRAHAERILTVLCGQPVAPLPQIEDPPLTRAPSAEAVRLAERLPASLTGAERRAKVNAIFAETACSERFRPFSRSEAEQLRALYALDTASIAAMDNVTLLTFN